MSQQFKAFFDRPDDDHHTTVFITVLDLGVVTANQGEGSRSPSANEGALFVELELFLEFLDAELALKLLDGSFFCCGRLRGFRERVGNGFEKLEQRIEQFVLSLRFFLANGLDVVHLLLDSVEEAGLVAKPLTQEIEEVEILNQIDGAQVLTVVDHPAEDGALGDGETSGDLVFVAIAAHDALQQLYYVSKGFLHISYTSIDIAYLKKARI